MAQIEPIDAYLGPARTGAAIGAILYQLDGSTVHAAFATTGWYEAPASSGAWHHAGLSLPDAGGVVAVGVSGTEYMRVAVGAARPLATDYTATRAAKLDNLDAAVSTRATPAQVNTEADQALADVGLTTTITGRIDAAITSRLATAGYTAPDNATISTINTRLGAPVGASISADIAGVQSDTNDIQTRLPAALVGGRIDSNVGAISSDATAADNAEAFFDGTGYAGTGNVIPTVTTVTNAVSANVTQISGDSTAADNLEAALDGTGGVTITAGLTGNVTGNLSGAVGSVTAGVTVTTNNDKTGYGLADGAITTAKFGVGAITASVIATDAIDADALAADAVSEIQSGLATAAALATVDTVVDAILVDTAEIGAAGAGLTALATQTSVNTIDDFLDTEIAAIKAVTDALPNGGALTTITNNVAAILLDTGTDGVVVAAASKSGYSLAADQSGVTVGTVNSLGATAQVQVNTQADTALADYDAPTKAELDTAQAAIIDAVPTTAEIDTQLSTTHGAGSWEASGGLTAAGIWSYANRTLTAATDNVTIVSAVNGGVVTLYAKDTWRFTINNASLSLSGYEAVALVIKSSESLADSASLLYVRSDSGLEYIDATDATAGDGTLTIDSATQITVNISIAVTDVDAGRYRWWIKGFDTTPTPDTGFTLATGVCLVLPAGLRAIA